MIFNIALNREEQLLLRALSQVRKIHYEGLLALGALIKDWPDSESLFVYLAKKYYGMYFEEGAAIQIRKLDEAAQTACIYNGPDPLVRAAKYGIESTERIQLEHAVMTLERVGLVKVYDDYVKWVEITPEGDNIVNRLDEGRLLFGRKPQIERTTIFFAGAMGPESGDIGVLYNAIIDPECTKLGFKPERIDLTEPHATITDGILDKIQSCKLIIADLTYARQSVYYEVGFAHGLGVRFLLTCRRDHKNGIADNSKVHFDLAQFKISYWQNQNGQIIWENVNMAPAERLKELLKG